MHTRSKLRSGSSSEATSSKTSTLAELHNLVEYHYKLALKLRKNFPLAALNLGAYQYGQLNQLSEAFSAFKLCAFGMRANETKAFHQHVQIQIECLISGAKLAIAEFGSNWSAHMDEKPNSSRQTNGVTKQTTTAATAIDSQASGSRTQSKTTNGGCSIALEWMDRALEMVRELELGVDLGYRQHNRRSAGVGWLDLNKQMATIHWIRGQCDVQSSALDELAKAVEFGARSQVSIAAKIYTNYADSLRAAGSAGTSTGRLVVAMLARAADAERAKAATDRHELARIHQRLGRELSKLGEAAEALKQAEEAIALWPNEPDFLSSGAQFAFDLGQLDRSEQLYSLALAAARSSSHHYHRENNAKPAGTDVRDRKLGSAHTNYGAILQVQGRIPEARAQYRLALDCDPGNSAAATNLRKLERTSSSSSQQ